MPRKGWSAMDVPSGWVQVLRGLRPTSVRWPMAADHGAPVAETKHRVCRGRWCQPSVSQRMWRPHIVHQIQMRFWKLHGRGSRSPSQCVVEGEASCGRTAIEGAVGPHRRLQRSPWLFPVHQRPTPAKNWRHNWRPICHPAADSVARS